MSVFMGTPTFTRQTSRQGSRRGHRRHDSTESTLNSTSSTTSSSAHTPISLRKFTPPATTFITIEEEPTWQNNENVNIEELNLRTEYEYKPTVWERLQDLYDDYGGRHVAPFLFLIVYTICTGALLSKIEYGEERRLVQLETVRLGKLRDMSIHAILKRVERETWFQKEDIRNRTRSVFKWFEAQVSLTVEPPIAWDIWGGMFYAGTIYTTIGYGNIAPRTSLGRALTMLFAVFGIPLVLVILNDFGKLFAYYANRTWKSMFNAARCRKNTQQTDSGYRPMIPGNLGDSPADTVDSNDMLNMSSSGPTTEEESQSIPLILAVLMCLGWMLLCAGLFLIWEKQWSYWESFYFFYVSLATIGLGDVTPGKPRMMLIMFWLVIIGLSLVSMLINVIQMKIEEWLQRIMKLVQAEYERALAMGDCPERDAILARIMKKQGWIARKMLPQIMSEKQQQKLEEVVEVAQEMAYENHNQSKNVATNSKTSQTEPYPRPKQSVTAGTQYECDEPNDPEPPEPEPTSSLPQKPEPEPEPTSSVPPQPEPEIPTTIPSSPEPASINTKPPTDPSDFQTAPPEHKREAEKLQKKDSIIDLGSSLPPIPMALPFASRRSSDDEFAPSYKTKGRRKSALEKMMFNESLKQQKKRAQSKQATVEEMAEESEDEYDDWLPPVGKTTSRWLDKIAQAPTEISATEQSWQTALKELLDDLPSVVITDPEGIERERSVSRSSRRYSTSDVDTSSYANVQRRPSSDTDAQNDLIDLFDLLNYKDLTETESQTVVPYPETPVTTARLQQTEETLTMNVPTQTIQQWTKQKSVHLESAMSQTVLPKLGIMSTQTEPIADNKQTEEEEPAPEPPVTFSSLFQQAVSLRKSVGTLTDELNPLATSSTATSTQTLVAEIEDGVPVVQSNAETQTKTIMSSVSTLAQATVQSEATSTADIQPVYDQTFVQTDEAISQDSDGPHRSIEGGASDVQVVSVGTMIDHQLLMSSRSTSTTDDGHIQPEAVSVATMMDQSLLMSTQSTSTMHIDQSAEMATVATMMDLVMTTRSTSTMELSKATAGCDMHTQTDMVTDDINEHWHDAVDKEAEPERVVNAPVSIGTSVDQYLYEALTYNVQTETEYEDAETVQAHSFQQQTSREDSVETQDACIFVQPYLNDQGTQTQMEGKLLSVQTSLGPSIDFEHTTACYESTCTQTGTIEHDMQTRQTQTLMALDTLSTQTDNGQFVSLHMQTEEVMMQDAYNQVSGIQMTNQQVQVAMAPRRKLLSGLRAQKTVDHVDSATQTRAIRTSKAVDANTQTGDPNKLADVRSHLRPPLEQSKSTWGKMMNRLSVKGKGKQSSSASRDSHEVAVQTHSFGVDRISQTDNSYLKIAKRLDNIRTQKFENPLAVAGFTPRRQSNTGEMETSMPGPSKPANRERPRRNSDTTELKDIWAKRKMKQAAEESEKKKSRLLR